MDRFPYMKAKATGQGHQGCLRTGYDAQGQGCWLKCRDVTSALYAVTVNLVNLTACRIT